MYEFHEFSVFKGEGLTDFLEPLPITKSLFSLCIEECTKTQVSCKNYKNASFENGGGPRSRSLCAGIYVDVSSVLCLLDSLQRFLIHCKNEPNKIPVINAPVKNA